MDGKHRDTPLGLILAAIPIQALLVAGVAAGLVSTHTQATVEYGQPGIGWTRPVPFCGDGSIQYGTVVPGAAKPADPMRGPACTAYAFANPDIPGQPVITAPCCGDGYFDPAP